jgi:hypothetical protein
MDVERLLKMKRDLDEAVDAVFIYLEDLLDTGIYRGICVLYMYIYRYVLICMYVCMHVRTYLCVHLCSHTHTRTHTHARTHTNTHTQERLTIR